MIHISVALASVMLLWSGADALAQSRPFETMDEARQRLSAERWQQYEEGGYQAPLGGYNQPLGTVVPRGTERPGYTTPQNYGLPLGGYGMQEESSPFGN
jgi:hypothetical protein